VDQSAWSTLIVSMVTCVRIRGALRSQTRVIQVLVDQEQRARPTLLVIQSVDVYLVSYPSLTQSQDVDQSARLIRIVSSDSFVLSRGVLRNLIRVNPVHVEMAPLLSLAETRVIAPVLLALLVMDTLAVTEESVSWMMTVW